MASTVRPREATKQSTVVTSTSIWSACSSTVCEMRYLRVRCASVNRASPRWSRRRRSRARACSDLAPAFRSPGVSAREDPAQTSRLRGHPRQHVEAVIADVRTDVEEHAATRQQSEQRLLAAPVHRRRGHEDFARKPAGDRQNDRTRRLGSLNAMIASGDSFVKLAKDRSGCPFERSDLSDEPGIEHVDRWSGTESDAGANA